MYPGWNARDNYRFGLKKKKRKRDKSDDPGKYDVTTKQSNFILFLLSLSIVDPKWHSLSKEDQSKYYEMAKKERQVHMQLHPNWSARDNYAKHKKKRRKRDKVRDGGSTSKKVFRTLCFIFVNIKSIVRCLILSWGVLKVILCYS